MRFSVFALFVVSTVLVAGCNSVHNSIRTSQLNTGDYLHIDHPNETDLPPVSGVVGNFLTARHAEAVHDHATAADLLYQLWQNDHKNTLLGYSAITNAVLSGRYAMALEVKDTMAGLGVVPETVGKKNALSVWTAIRHVKEANYTAAVREMQASNIAIGPEQYIRPLVLAWAYLGKGDSLKAREILRDQKKTNPIRNILQLNLVYMAIYQQDYVLGAQELRTLIDRLDEVPSDLHALYAKLLFWSEGEVAAQSYLRVLADTHRRDTLMQELRQGHAPSPATVQLERIEHGLAEGLNEISKLLRNEIPHIGLFYVRASLYLNPSNQTALVLIGNILFDMERYEEAVFQLGKISNPAWESYREAMTLAADAELELGQPEAAIARLERGIEMLSDIDLLSKLGQVYQSQKQYDKAIEIYDRVIAARPAQRPEWSDFYFRGICYERLKRWPQAEQDFLRALDIEPDNAYVLNYLGYSWIDQRQHIPQALKMLERAVQLEPRNGYIIDSYGWALYRIENFPAAAEYLEQAVLLMPSEAVLNDHLGDVYWHLGRKVEAKYQWERALGLEWETPEERQQVEEKLAGTRTPKP